MTTMTTTLRKRIKAAGWTLATYRAWRASCAHWKRMATGKARKGEKPTGLNCALCDLFAHNEDRSTCEGCPVSQETLAPFCNGTPYFEARKAWKDFGLNSPEFRAAALNELEFLEGLLP